MYFWLKLLVPLDNRRCLKWKDFTFVPTHLHFCHKYYTTFPPKIQGQGDEGAEKVALLPQGETNSAVQSVL